MKKYFWFNIILLAAFCLNTKYAFSQINEKEVKLGFHISLPHINSFNLRPPIEDKRIVNTGFWGFEIGLDYFKSKNSFFSISGSANSDFFVPVPASPGIDSEYEIMSSVYLHTSYNNRLRNWLFSYGLTFGKNKWSLKVPVELTGTQIIEPKTESYLALGVQGQISYFIKKKLFLGLIYRPTFYRFKINQGLQYEHLISITIGRQINKH